MGTVDPPVLLIELGRLAELGRIAEAAYPDECCGLVVGRALPSDNGQHGWRVTRLVPAPNRAADPRRAFDLDPATHFALLRELRMEGRDDQLLGHYHSHPNAAAQPSERDRAQAHDPGMIWLIVAVSPGQPAAIAAWQAALADDGQACFRPVSLLSTEDCHASAKNP